MGDSSAQREREFVGWIEEERQLYREQSQRLFLVRDGAGVALATAAAASGDESQAKKDETASEWSRGVLDGLIVGVAVMGACFGFPIGALAGGVVIGFLGGLTGAVLGTMAVLALARVVKLVLRGAKAAVMALAAYARPHLLRR